MDVVASSIHLKFKYHDDHNKSVKICVDHEGYINLCNIARKGERQGSGNKCGLSHQEVKRNENQTSKEGTRNSDKYDANISNLMDARNDPK